MKKAIIQRAVPEQAEEISAVVHKAMEQYAADSKIPILLESLKENASDFETFIRCDTVFQASLHGKIVGAIRICDSSDGSARISRFSVLPSVQMSGVGSELFAAAEAHIMESGYHQAVLYTATTNLRTVRFYTSRGFCLTDTDTSAGYSRGFFVKQYSAKKASPSKPGSPGA